MERHTIIKSVQWNFRQQEMWMESVDIRKRNQQDKIRKKNMKNGLEVKNIEEKWNSLHQMGMVL